MNCVQKALGILLVMSNSHSFAIHEASEPPAAREFQKPSHVQAAPISFTVTNNTDQELTLAGLYEVRPSQHPGLLDMPNPFEYIKIPAYTSEKSISFISVHRKGRLGRLIEVSISPVKKNLSILFDREKEIHRIESIINPEDIEKLSEENESTISDKETL
jgi:hypothetical protein